MKYVETFQKFRIKNVPLKIIRTSYERFYCIKDIKETKENNLETNLYSPEVDIEYS